MGSLVIINPVANSKDPMSARIASPTTSRSLKPGTEAEPGLWHDEIGGHHTNPLPQLPLSFVICIPEREPVGTAIAVLKAVSGSVKIPRIFCSHCCSMDFLASCGPRGAAGSAAGLTLIISTICSDKRFMFIMRRDPHALLSSDTYGNHAMHVQRDRGRLRMRAGSVR